MQIKLQTTLQSFNSEMYSRCILEGVIYQDRTFLPGYANGPHCRGASVTCTHQPSPCGYGPIDQLRMQQLNMMDSVWFGLRG